MSERPLPLPVSFVGSVLMCLSWDQLIKSRDKDACFCRDNLPTTYTPSPYLLSLLMEERGSVTLGTVLSSGFPPG